MGERVRLTKSEINLISKVAKELGIALIRFGEDHLGQRSVTLRNPKNGKEAEFYDLHGFVESAEDEEYLGEIKDFNAAIKKYIEFDGATRQYKKRKFK